MKIKVIISIVTVMAFSFVTTSVAAETLQMRAAPVQKLQAAPSTSQPSPKAQLGTMVNKEIQQIIAVFFIHR